MDKEWKTFRGSLLRPLGFAGQAGFKVNWFGLRSILILEPLNAYKKAKNKVFQNLDWPLTYIFPRHMSIKTGYAMEGWNTGFSGL
jgi:hypothetical protein